MVLKTVSPDTISLSDAIFGVHPPIIAAQQNQLTAEAYNFTHMLILSKT